MSTLHHTIRFNVSVLFFVLILQTGGFAEVSIVYDTTNSQIQFAVNRLHQAVRQIPDTLSYSDIARPMANPNIAVVTRKDQLQSLSGLNETVKWNSSLEKEGFQIAILPPEEEDEITLVVIARDANGAMYGVLDVAEQILNSHSLHVVESKVSNPRFEFRAIKFNLPWSPYRSGAATDIHLETCRDLHFWQAYLDMMAVNRFNVLSLWNLHPFTYMIRPEHYPGATPFSDSELAEWHTFWKTLFRMAKDRGIETYIVNWNIVVSPEFARAYGVKEKNDTSDLVRRYTKECVTQVINEYEDLTGIGVTLADWMNHMTPKDREDWIEETFVAGMKAAGRKVKFIHRSVLAGSPIEMRRVIDNAELPDPVWVEVKFNWSHGHSTPRLSITHDYSSGKIDERFWNPAPANYKIVWMIRNEDFFILRWGAPDFIRSHIAMNDEDYVGGYFVGSEGYIPAKDYSHQIHRHQTWQYAFEKQWLFYELWGRLLYHPELPDKNFAMSFERKFGNGTGKSMLQSYQAASRVATRIASFHAGTWDYTLYSEGFLSPVPSRGLDDKVSAFISIEEIIYHEVLDAVYLTIPEYVDLITKNHSISDAKITPIQLAGDTETDSRQVLQYTAELHHHVTPYSGSLECEINDLETWAHLGLYFADKLRAGVALEQYRKTGNYEQKNDAVELLEKCVHHWNRICEITQSHYVETPHVSGEAMAWCNYSDQVKRDVTIAKEAKFSEGDVK